MYKCPANVCKCLQMSEPLQMLLRMFANMQMFANSGECPHPCKCLQISVQMWTLCTAFPRVLLLTYTTFSASPRATHEVRRHAARLIYRCAKKCAQTKKTSKKICGLKKFDYFCSASQYEKVRRCTEPGAIFLHILRDTCGVLPPCPSRNRSGAPFRSCEAAGKETPHFCF